MRLLHGDCLEELRKLPDNSVDSVVTDPPYGLSFMGKKWDYDVPSEDVWSECLRVLKPGGHLLAFAGTRTQHRMAVRIEDAGFEIRDMIAWVYGSGFPKSHNLKDEWEGWGTALKPALEPITVARKPFAGTVAENVQAHGTGAINVDVCRVGTNKRVPGGAMNSDAPNWLRKHGHGSGFGPRNPEQSGMNPNIGRWPANLIHDGSEEVVRLFPYSKTGNVGSYTRQNTGGYSGSMPEKNTSFHKGDQGSAARFFYCAKASKRDRDEGLEERLAMRYGEKAQGPLPQQTPSKPVAQRNHHPTVKPTALMQYLCRLVTPPGGKVLDPFMGSGSTGKAALAENFDFIGIERDAEYYEIAKHRIGYVVQST